MYQRRVQVMEWFGIMHTGGGVMHVVSDMHMHVVSDMRQKVATSVAVCLTASKGAPDTKQRACACGALLAQASTAVNTCPETVCLAAAGLASQQRMAQHSARMSRTKHTQMQGCCSTTTSQKRRDLPACLLACLTDCVSCSFVCLLSQCRPGVPGTQPAPSAPTP